MPSLSINYNPVVGPLLQLMVWKPGFNPQATPTSPTAPYSPTFYMALIDTGASCSAASAKVIADQTLTPLGKQQVGGVHGLKSTNIYQFQIALAFPQSQVATGAVSASIHAFAVTGTKFVPGGAFDVLLGRDILCKGIFNMSFDGHAVFSI